MTSLRYVGARASNTKDVLTRGDVELKISQSSTSITPPYDQAVEASALYATKSSLAASFSGKVTTAAVNAEASKYLDKTLNYVTVDSNNKIPNSQLPPSYLYNQEVEQSVARSFTMTHTTVGTSDVTVSSVYINPTNLDRWQPMVLGSLETNPGANSKIEMKVLDPSGRVVARGVGKHGVVCTALISTTNTYTYTSGTTFRLVGRKFVGGGTGTFTAFKSHCIIIPVPV